MTALVFASTLIALPALTSWVGFSIGRLVGAREVLADRTAESYVSRGGER